VPAEGEARVRKLYRNSFEATDLEEVLAGLGVGHVYVCGAQTNNCVRFTGHGALDRGYDVTLLMDAHTTTDFEFAGKTVSAEVLVSDLNASFYENELPGRKADAMVVEKAFA
jgi:nicotinamidase-related amidase